MCNMRTSIDTIKKIQFDSDYAPYTTSIELGIGPVYFELLWRYLLALYIIVYMWNL
jgi:hypothetical protein